MTWLDLIKRARFYVDDDHEENDGWVPETSWLDLANAEYRQQYRRWVRIGLVKPAHTVAPFTGSTSISSVLAVVGVAEDLGSGTPKRILNQGDQPWDEVTGLAQEWYATGSADTLSIGLYPADSTHNYVVRYITRPALVTSTAAAFDGPDGSDERIVLGMARRAMIKESAASRRLDDEIREADAELNMTAWGRREAPLVRRVTPARFKTLWSVEPGRWVYFG